MSLRTQLLFVGAMTACANPQTGHPPATSPMDCQDSPFLCSWTHKALILQDKLIENRPMVSVSWRETHNSYNSVGYEAPRANDPNQQLTITAQLQHDIQAIELDLHWVKSTRTGELTAVLCHGLAANLGHIGCDVGARTLAEGLDEIVAWLQDNPERILRIDLEDQLATPSGGFDITAHNRATDTIVDALGPYLYRPPQDSTCHPFPRTLSLQQVRDAGAQVILTSICGAGSAWPSIVFDIKSVRFQAAFTGLEPYPTCTTSDLDITDLATWWTRVWEDSTKITKLADPNVKPITAASVTALASCGLTSISLDQLVHDDPRLQAWVWSWAEGEPSSTQEACAQLGENGRLFAKDCGESAAFACFNGQDWTASESVGPWQDGQEYCRTHASGFDVPRTAQELTALMTLLPSTSSTRRVWVNWHDPTGQGIWPIDVLNDTLSR